MVVHYIFVLVHRTGMKEHMSRPGLLQRFFDFYSVYFGVTAPPPEKQRLVLGLLLAFVVGLVIVLVVVAKVVSTL